MGTRARTVETLPDKALAASPDTPARKSVDHELLARLVVREAKTFYYSALEAGYSETVARRGLKALASESKPVAEAIRKESERVSISLDKLKPIAVNRLYLEISDINSTNGMKAIELAGRFRETDWFVRNNESTIGVFLTASETLPEPIDVLPTKYEE